MSQKPFDIGLVRAGAVSAGAYTAGVIDFLVQALDGANAAGKAVPPHECGYWSSPGPRRGR
jgi:hypothetical protein